MKILVVVAHPDDEVLGCGGTIIKHNKNGDDVSLIVLADGVTSRIYDSKISRNVELLENKASVEIRKNECYQAGEIMGIKKENCALLGLPDQRLDTVSILNIIKHIEEISSKINPDIVYTHHWGDINKDHRVCNEATLTAFRPSRQINKKAKIFCFEILGNMNYLPPKKINQFNPNYYVDISSSIDNKLEALGAYQSEQKSLLNSVVFKGIRSLSRNRAKKTKGKYAEAFVKLC